MTIAKQIRTKSRRLRLRAGYTLLEILIVLAVIGLLVALVGTQLTRVFEGAQVNAARTQMVALKRALGVMQLEIGRYPTDAEGLSLLIQAPGEGVPGWNGPYLDNELPVDPWKNPYLYVAPTGGEEPSIGTFGSDGQEGGSGNAADVYL